MKYVSIVLLFYVFHGFAVFTCKDKDLPMWSWGFAQHCCDVHPSYVHFCPIGECGDIKDDPSYFIRFNQSYFSSSSSRPIVDNEGPTSTLTVYSASVNLPDFMSLFYKLPFNSSIILVSGLEDGGVPMEIMGIGRSGFDGGIIPKHHPLYQNITRLREFILDPRLKRWYAQNYDLVFGNYDTNGNSNSSAGSSSRPTVGCRKSPPYCDSESTLVPVYDTLVSTLARSQAEKDLITSKIFPLPIGVDFHSRLDKSKKDAFRNKEGICRQQEELLNQRYYSSPFSRRPLAISADFSCPQDFKPQLPPSTTNTNTTAAAISAAVLLPVPPFVPRGGICELLIMHKHKDISRERSGGVRKRFWKSLSDHAFALAPPGNGQDTHRLWEILLLGSIPIVISSPLDRLICQYPSIILKDWSVLFARAPKPRIPIITGGISSSNSNNINSSYLLSSSPSPKSSFASTINAKALRPPVVLVVGHHDDDSNWVQSTLKTLKGIVEKRYGKEPFSPKMYSRMTVNYWKEVVQGKTPYRGCPNNYIITTI